jgi:hypothetical protein
MGAGRTGGPVQSNRTAQDQDTVPQPAGPWPGFGGAPPAVAAASSAGVAATASHSDHTHAQAFNAVVGTGPTAFGTVGTGTLPGHSDQTSPAYRSDLPLSTTWFIDPVNGSDAITNGGTTSATALKTLRQLAMRWWCAEITSNTTVTILGNVPAGDIAGWMAVPGPNITVTFIGSLGATTGFGGAAIDNTLFTGTVTGFVAASASVAADDIELTDTGIPVSWTASGALAQGVICKRTNSTALYWYVLSDLAAKTARITVPMLNTSVKLSAALAVNDTYGVYQMWTWPTQSFGPLSQSLVTDSLYNNSATPQGFGQGVSGPRRTWMGNGNSTIVQPPIVYINPMFSGNSTVSIIGSGSMYTKLRGGGARAAAAGANTNLLLQQINCTIDGAFICERIPIRATEGSRVTVEEGIAVHDTTTQMLYVDGDSSISFTAGSTANFGCSGKGNSGNIVTLNSPGSLSYSGLNSAAPPFVAGSTSGTQVAINTIAYTVAQLPVIGARLSSSPVFPGTQPQTIAAGAQALLINNGPAGIGTLTAKYYTFYDGAGVLSYGVYWQ